MVSGIIAHFVGVRKSWKTGHGKINVQFEWSFVTDIATIMCLIIDGQGLFKNRQFFRTVFSCLH